MYCFQDLFNLEMINIYKKENRNWQTKNIWPQPNVDLNVAEGSSTKELSSDDDELSVVSVSESSSLGRTTMTFSGNSARSALNMN